MKWIRKWLLLSFKWHIYTIHIYSVCNWYLFTAIALWFCSLFLSSLVLIEHFVWFHFKSSEHIHYTYFYFFIVALEFAIYILTNQVHLWVILYHFMCSASTLWENIPYHLSFVALILLLTCYNYSLYFYY